MPVIFDPGVTALIAGRRRRHHDATAPVEPRIARNTVYPSLLRHLATNVASELLERDDPIAVRIGGPLRALEEREREVPEGGAGHVARLGRRPRREEQRHLRPAIGDP